MTSESSKSRVTITLGRSGQVVKRAGSSIDSYLDDPEPAVGSKRPIRDRLGSNVDSFSQCSSKRVRGDTSAFNDNDDIHLSQNDLRFKIMLKQSQKSQQTKVDLRDILSRPAQSSTNSVATIERRNESKETRERYSGAEYGRKQFPDPRDDRKQFPDPRDGNRFSDTRDARKLSPDPRGGRRQLPDPQDGRQSVSLTRETRLYNSVTRERQAYDPRERLPDSRQQRMPETREARESIAKPKDVYERMPEPRSASMMRRIPDPRMATSQTKADSIISSYSPWTLDRLRRSPDRVLVSSKETLTRRNEEFPRKLPSLSHDDARTSSYKGKDYLEFSRPISSSSYLPNTSTAVAPVRTMAPVTAPLSQYGSLVQRSPYPVQVDDQLTVDSFLHSLGLDKFAIHFKAEEVDMYALRQMGDNDLKELGIPMGPRKKILLSLQPRSKQQA